MKKTSMALAAVALATAGSAAAQSSNVTLYGIVDSGIEYVNHAGPNGGGVTRLVSGGKNTSRWGMRGTEDLGGGLKAVFNLESGIAVDTGKLDTDNVLFDRRAVVGLAGGFGQVVAGRTFTTTYDFMLPYDPMGYAPNYSWATSSTATGGRKDGLFSRSSDAIRYDGTFGGLKLGATVGFGEAAGNFKRSSKYDLGIGYSVGGFSAAATWDRQNGAGTSVTPADTTDYIQGIHAGASYDFGALKLFAGYRNYKRAFTTTAATQRSDMYWAGASYDFTPAFTLYGAVYKQNIKGVNNSADPILFSLRGQYALSKRTTAYLSAAYAKAQNGQNVSLSRDVVGYGNSQIGVTAGLQHRF
ncbi:porin [Ralstonia insidiosa]|uniref:Porin n=1 Tax=Ralstonia insidiosa TaxID=190721 RepID=A0A191ZVZ3_9RALS|nr:porin [Ralstonia insidiosa]ANJ72325.1 porin [Ralstonia insidiosa]KAB0472873.1 porin [Ralstonia insidiosa]MBY4907502.1 porin [Ralstonia insidiosa]